MEKDQGRDGYASILKKGDLKRWGITVIIEAYLILLMVIMHEEIPGFNHPRTGRGHDRNK